MKINLLAIAIGGALFSQPSAVPRPLKAYQLSDEEIWAGCSAEEAVATAIAETGEAESYQLEDARELTDEELDRPIPFDQEPGESTLRIYLGEMTEPGLLAAQDY